MDSRKGQDSAVFPPCILIFRRWARDLGQCVEEFQSRVGETGACSDRETLQEVPSILFELEQPSKAQQIENCQST